MLANVPSPLATSTISGKAREKLISEFRYLRANATGTLARFMDFLTHGYMIDNMALLITGTLHQRDTRELLERCHPLGVFETLPVLCVATTVDELYNSVLIDTPLAPYFRDLSSAALNDLNIEIIRNTLYRAYLEDFHAFCQAELPGPGAELMAEVLGFEADRRAINITINSFGSTELTRDQRRKLYPTFGKLWPEGSFRLSHTTDVQGVREVVESVGEYKCFFEPGQERSLEDLFYRREMEIAKATFTQQFTCAVVLAWVKLKEQEIRNVTWIAECIAQRQKDRIGNYISIF